MIDTNPKCKRKFTRKKAFNLLLTLSHQCEENFTTLLQQLYQFKEADSGNKNKSQVTEYDAEVGMRSATGYVGLKNFGCTCYMNALIQQMFMMQDFRKGILKAEVKE